MSDVAGAAGGTVPEGRSALAPAAQTRRARRRAQKLELPAPVLPWWAAIPAAALGGYLLDVAAPEVAWWWAAFAAVLLVTLALWRRGAWAAAGIGAIAGAGFWLPHIGWLTLYLGPVPWLGLCAVMIVWYALFGAAAGFVTRRLTGVWQPAVAVAGLWVLREQLQGLVPYGGFAWGRLAHTQADGPLVQSVSWLGFAGLSGLVAVIATLGVAAAVTGERRTFVRAGAVAAALGLLAAVIPAAPAASEGTLRIAAVQGNSKSAIFDDRENGSVLADHVDATEELLDRLEAEGDSVDVIVWPENSAEFELPSNLIGAQQVAKLAKRAGAPIVVGSILANEDGTYSNSSLVWGPDGAAGERYDKRYPVPFAEYMPNRDFFHALAPDLVDLVQLEYAAGQLPAAYDVDTEAGVVRAGLAICFDIIFDQQARAMQTAGAEIIFAQTNNADFGRTDESVQQLAIAKLRAVETGRALVNISTVGTSAVVLPNGDYADELVPFTADALVADVPLVQGVTPAVAAGWLIASLWCLAGLAGIALAAVQSAVRR